MYFLILLGFVVCNKADISLVIIIILIIEVCRFSFICGFVVIGRDHWITGAKQILIVDISSVGWILFLEIFVLSSGLFSEG